MVVRAAGLAALAAGYSAWRWLSKRSEEEEPDLRGEHEAAPSGHANVREP